MHGLRCCWSGRLSKGNKTLLIIVALVVLVVGGYKWRYPTFSWHQKLTVEIETPQGVVSGSAVVSVQVSFGAFGVGDVSGVTSNWSGEAAFIDLGNNRHLFALLGHPKSLAQNTFREAVLGDANAHFPSMKTFYPKMLKLRQPSTVLSKHYPMLVTFTEINDPKSVKKVNPYNLATSFGAGYKLKAITLEITDEPVTSGQLAKIIPCIKAGKGCNWY